ncbi:hypothetical protein VTN96DRAFT_7833 [Rasamsonia emersonii]
MRGTISRTIPSPSVPPLGCIHPASRRFLAFLAAGSAPPLTPRANSPGNPPVAAVDTVATCKQHARHREC